MKFLFWLVVVTSVWLGEGRSLPDHSSEEFFWGNWVNNHYEDDSSEENWVNNHYEDDSSEENWFDWGGFGGGGSVWENTNKNTGAKSNTPLDNGRDRDWGNERRKEEEPTIYNTDVATKHDGSGGKETMTEDNFPTKNDVTTESPDIYGHGVTTESNVLFVYDDKSGGDDTSTTDLDIWGGGNVAPEIEIGSKNIKG